jgi:putative ABC transport system substrate-binding protein
VCAQSAGDLPRIAIVEQGEPVAAIALEGHPWWSAFLGELAALGQVEGRDVVVERWSAAGQGEDGVAALTADVVASAPDLIVARGIRAISAFREATSTIPVIGIGTFPDGLARPSRQGNVTGMNATSGVELYQKLLQLLHDAVPGLSRVAWLGPRDTWDGPIGAAAREGAWRLGVPLVPVLIDGPPDDANLGRAFAAIREEALDGLFVGSSPEMTVHRQTIAGLAAAARLPAIALQREYADVGLLMAYGPDFLDIYRRAAGYADRILRGADPAELPIDGARAFEFVVNLSTARALGLELPPSIMLFATEVIE